MQVSNQSHDSSRQVKDKLQKFKVSMRMEKNGVTLNMVVGSKYPVSGSSLMKISCWCPRSISRLVWDYRKATVFPTSKVCNSDLTPITKYNSGIYNECFSPEYFLPFSDSSVWTLHSSSISKTTNYVIAMLSLNLIFIFDSNMSTCQNEWAAAMLFVN